MRHREHRKLRKKTKMKTKLKKGRDTNRIERNNRRRICKESPRAGLID